METCWAIHPRRLDSVQSDLMQRNWFQRMRFKLEPSLPSMGFTIVSTQFRQTTDESDNDVHSKDSLDSMGSNILSYFQLKKTSERDRLSMF